MNRFCHLVYGCCLILSSCAPSERKADFVFLNGAEPESLDPPVITGQLEGRLVAALFEGLTSHDPHARVAPGMAERWEISPDGRLYIFHLRADARWGNGDPVTAHDFVGSWQRALHPETASEYAYQLFYITNAEAYNAGKIADFSQVGVRAIDDRTLQVEINNPTPYFLDLCGFPTLMPVHLKTVLQYGDHWIKPGKIVSNGAYLLEEWRINHRIRLRANPHYWDRANVGLEVVDVLPTERDSVAYNLYHSGGADLILDKGLIPSMLLDFVRERPDFHASASLGTYFYRFNVTRKPFDHPMVRKAFAMAIDKQRIVDKITKAGEPVTGHLVPPGMEGYIPPQGLGYDPDAARRLLAEVGFSGGKGFKRISLLYADRSSAKATATEIQAMLKKELGIEVDLMQQEWKVYLNSMRRLDYDFCASAWIGDYNDPNTFLDMFVTNGGNNRTGWSNPKYDELIRLAAGELDAPKRMQILHNAEVVLCNQELPIIPLYHYVGVQFYDPRRIDGVYANVLDDHPLKYIRKIKK